MNPDTFDPFSGRLARDIRNSLSKAFRKSLALHEPLIIQRVADGFLGQQLPPPYQDYIEDRLARYAEAREAIIKHYIIGVVEQSQILWELQLYYEMHELLEGIWLESAGTRRKALQGLIRAAGMKIHAERGNTGAAQKMAQKALTDIQENRAALADFQELDNLLAEAGRMASVSRN